MNGLVVFTAIMGRFSNKLRPPLWAPRLHNGASVGEGDRSVCFVCFSDFLGSAPEPWHLLPPVWEHEDPRRTARYHKVMAHELFPNAEVTLWADGNQQLAEDPWILADKYLTPDTHVATYKHPLRRCVHEELDACIKLEKDNPALMRSQVMSYQQAGYPKNHGMCETTVMLRRNVPEIHGLNEQWWAEIQQGSKRDQLSFNFVLWRLGLKYARMAGRRDKPAHFKYFAHR